MQAKAEFDAAHQIQLHFSKAVETESKVERLLEVSNADVFLHTDKQLSMAPLKKLLPAREKPEVFRFTVSQLEALSQALGTSAFVSVEQVSNVLVNAHCATKEGMESGTGVPHDWVKCTSADIREAVLTLDPLSSGFINRRKLLADLILMECERADKEALSKSLKGCAAAMDSDLSITSDAFGDVPMFFAQ